MRRAILILAILSVTRPAAASGTSDVLAVVKQFVDAFNKGDTKAALATCAPQTAIIDEFAPYLWQGATACADWANDFDAFATKNGISGLTITTGKPRHVDLDGDRAYVVMPANLKYRMKGKVTSENGSVFTLALEKLPEGWRITGWAWAKH